MATGKLMVCILMSLALNTSCLKNEQDEWPDSINNPPPPELPCNGHPELCDRSYDSVAYATTHNSYNYEFGFTQFTFPNQDFDVSRQLSDGIRGLMLDVYDEGGALVVYHGFSVTGSEPLSTSLGHIRDFLEENPREVVSIIFETEIDGNRIESALAAAGLLDYVHTQTHGTPWPTLEEMIEVNRRLVIFTENEANAGTPAWFHYAWGFIVDTPYEYANRGEFTCDYNRGSADNNLFLINHWISAPLIGTGIKDSAISVNAEPVLLPRVQECMSTHNRLPNFVAVDFYAQGDLLKVVNQINGVGQ